MRECVSEPVRTVMAALRALRWRSAPPWPGFGKPFNGQANRTGTVERLLGVFQPDALVETGTFLGDTTVALAARGLPVYTVEIKPEFFHLARRRLARRPNVTLLCGDSVEALSALRAALPFRRPFAYLDAHWWDRLPLAGELAALTTGWTDVVAVIDDCAVPGDAGYAYDVYDGKPIGLEGLELPEDMAAAYPGVPSSAETGARRGTLYLGHGPGGRDAIERLVSERQLLPARRSPST